MTGSAVKNLKMFKALCGDGSLPWVILVTTMWDAIPQELGNQREHELLATPEFWGYMIKNNSRSYRHAGRKFSAMSILSYLINKKETTVLAIQEQLAAHKDLDQTDAGQELAREKLTIKKLYEDKLKAAQIDMEQALEDRDHSLQQGLLDIQDGYQKRIAEAVKDQKALKVSLEKIYQDKEKDFQKEIERLEKEEQDNVESLKVQQKESQKLKERMRKIEHDMEKRDKEHAKAEARAQKKEHGHLKNERAREQRELERKWAAAKEESDRLDAEGEEQEQVIRTTDKLINQQTRVASALLGGSGVAGIVVAGLAATCLCVVM